jgi:signal transduction histidine kinase/ketosteroid isomerase-like protein
MKKKKSPTPAKKKSPAKRKAVASKKIAALEKLKVILTKKQEAELRQVYDLYWSSYVRGDIKMIASMLVDDYSQVGSAEAEFFANKKEAVKFLRDTIDQVAGKAELRNRVKKIDYLDDSVLINERCDLYVLSEKKWVFYSKFRASTLMKAIKGSWKIIHQHSSVPDLKALDGENLAINKVAAENQLLREAVKRRTVELEQKNRELEIEAAMEKVRVRSLAMQKPGELAEIAEVLRKEMGALGVEELETSSIYILDETKETTECWYAIKDIHGKNKKLVTDHMTLRLDETWVGRQMKKFHLSKENRTSIVMKGENRKEWINHCAEKSSVLQGYYGGEIPERTYHLLKFSNGFMGAASPGEISVESWNLLQRATAVFSFAYKRFSDLQKAEAQVREAQIEVALERVRSRSLAMHKSDELQDVVTTFFERLNELEIETDSTSIHIIKEGSKDMIIWTATPQKNYSTYVRVPYFNSEVARDLLDNWETSQGTVCSNNFSLEKKNEFWNDVLEHTDYQYISEDRKKYILGAECWIISVAYTRNAFIALNRYYNKLFSEKENEILKRFANVFEQTYTRFLDLQKAEAQAREAQIEAALEKVRSRSMAMHKSEELKEVIQVVVEQFVQLKIHVEHAGFIMDYKERDDMHIWLADPHKVPSELTIPYFDSPHWNSFIEAKKQGLDFFANQLSFDVKNRFYQDLFMLFPVPKEAKDYYLSCSGLAISTVLLDNIGLYIENFSGTPYNEEENKILMRFGKVFQQTYTRFLDLQKAEVQAREAQIEVALERVRSRSMAMHKSDELADLSLELVKQVQALGVATWFCAFNIYEDENGSLEWGSNGEGTFPRYRTPREGVFLRYYQAGQKGETLLINEIGEHECPAHYEYLCSLPRVGDQLLKMKEAGIPFPTSQIDHVAFFKYGYLLFITYEPTPESHDIFKRFAKVFEQTYTRFLDLQKAEAQAREAVKQSSLDRIRGEIASMRTTNDLDRITPLIWKELNILGIPFVRCGVFIMEEEKQIIHTYLSTPDGKAIAAFHLPYYSTTNLAEAINGWRTHQRYVTHWVDKDFSAQAEVLVQQGAIATREQYLNTIPKDGIYLHFLPFLQGMLYVGHLARLSDNDLDLIQSVADAFSTAYARYEDFNKLEVAKQQVDKTLVELKQAQQQLVQSEKMASLGELTAGIAHEIQNPLNFVNNFSEVSNELIKDIQDIRRNTQDGAQHSEEDEILNDIAGNLEKINHHGKRAADIVKGMLQHSRSSSGIKEPTDINALADEYLRLAYHGLRAKDKSFNATMKTNFDESIGSINIIPQDIGRVILNLITNAFYAVNERQKLLATSHELLAKYEPTVSVSTEKEGNKILISVKDNGNGIPQKILDKIFQPFFTTKPTGQGTGLGLSLSYDIVKAHGGEIKVNTKENEGTEFTIRLPA